MRQWPMEKTPCPLWSCWLPRPGWLFPVGDLSQEQPRLQHFYGLGWMWEPPQTMHQEALLLLLDVMAEHEQLGTRRDPCHLLCRDVGRVSTRPSKSLARTRAPAPAPKCKETGKPAQRWAADAQTELKWFPKTSQAPFSLIKLPQSPAVAQSCIPAAVERSLGSPAPWPPPPLLLQSLHLPVRGGAGPREILRGQCSGSWCHGLLNGCFLAVGFEQRCRSVGQHRPLVAAELGPPVLKPHLWQGKGSQWGPSARRDVPNICPMGHSDVQDERREGTVPAPAWGEAEGVVFSHTNLCSPGLWPR